MSSNSQFELYSPKALYHCFQKKRTRPRVFTLRRRWLAGLICQSKGDERSTAENTQHSFLIFPVLLNLSLLKVTETGMKVWMEGIIMQDLIPHKYIASKSIKSILLNQKTIRLSPLRRKTMCHPVSVRRNQTKFDLDRIKPYPENTASGLTFPTSLWHWSYVKVNVIGVKVQSLMKVIVMQSMRDVVYT